ncbi:hypothetical protein BN14_03376 [Rhizoctonia solani AG-1 IB]|uniref:Transcription factor TFIIE alpha subunit C-terminal domain-containing protein n=1 Tax=Thanatephorus cucumeris (strain AG1-IB / isolate 7/3/14) TaxID=1108050 RepID=M5BS70_THACB|nr:hypothetical protein BN14_03376 [Rhizoctonia solani AG-1 IB]
MALAEYRFRAFDHPWVKERSSKCAGEIDLEAYFSSLNKDETPEADTPPLSNGATASQSSLGKRERDMEDDLFPSSKMQKMEDVGEDDSTNPIVYVAGEAKRFRDITETEQELMTPEEYEAYAELTVALT